MTDRQTDRMASQSDRVTNIVSRTCFAQQNEKPSTKAEAEAIKHNRVACIRILNVWHSHFFPVFGCVCVCGNYTLTHTQAFALYRLCFCSKIYYNDSTERFFVVGIVIVLA